MALATTADMTTARCEAKRATLATWAEVTPDTVSAHLRALAERRLIARREQRRIDGGRRADEFLLLAPWVTEWPDGEPLPDPLPDSREGGRNEGAPSPLSGETGTTTTNGHVSDRKEERASTRDEFPDDLPSELHDVAVTVGKILKATALTRGQKREVTRAAVGHAVLTYPDRDHVRVARDVEFWLLHGKGARKPCADIVARFRNFLDGSEPMAGPPLPAGVAPIRSVRDERERGRQWGTERSVAIMHGASPEEAVRIANERVGV